MNKGKLITLYGVNNIGKSTQAKLLVEKLNKSGFRSQYLKYPIYELEPTGSFLNKTLRTKETLRTKVGFQKISEEEFQLWFTLNRYQYEPQLKKMLNEGLILIAEDYTFTGVAWGAAKGADINWLESMNKYLLNEDLAIFMKGKRFLEGKEDNHIHENDDLLIEKTNQILNFLSEKKKWKTVDATGSIDEVSNKMWLIIEQFLQSK